MPWIGPSQWHWDKLDEIFASFARPYQQYMCATAIAASLLIYITTAKVYDALVLSALTVPCAGLAGWSANLRSVDKKTAASVEISQSQPSKNTVTAEVK